MLVYYIYRLLGLIAPLVPPSLGYPLAITLGALFYHLKKGTRANIYNNVTHILGNRSRNTSSYQAANDGDDIKAIVRGVFRSMGKNYYDLFRLPTLSQAEIARLIKVEGWEHIDKALSKGKGLILVQAHIGNINILAQVPALRNITVVFPVERVKPEVLFQYICSLRANKNLRLIPVDGALFELFRALRRNELVGLAADRDITESGIVVDFFGAPARLPDGYAQLALRTGAPIIVGFSRRLPDNTSIIHLDPPLK
ncbi:MAG: hypothetical protein DRH12_18090, partial [Deltaproteobacteria bacterium]